MLPRYVRVQLFMSLELLRRVDRMPNLVAEVPLERSGELDLRRVRDLWGLDTCAVCAPLLAWQCYTDSLPISQPIDPLRWQIFEPYSDHLSPLAVHALSQHYGAIKFIGIFLSPRSGSLK
jgi:hypothetical protein